MGKRKRSQEILATVAEMFGMGLVPFADGGTAYDRRASGAARAAWEAVQGRAPVAGGGSHTSITTVQLGPGMIQVHAGPGTDMRALETMLNRALAQFSRNLSREIRTRRVQRAA
jgi:hypothetical protein